MCSLVGFSHVGAGVALAHPFTAAVPIPNHPQRHLRAAAFFSAALHSVVGRLTVAAALY